MPEAYPLRLPLLATDLQMLVHERADAHVSRQIREQGIWEPYETRLICQWLNPGDRFVDAGANIGYFTLLGAHCVGESGRVICFEPEPANYQLLCDNLSLNKLQGRVDAVQAGLAARTGEATLYLHPDNLGDHQLHAADTSREQVRVPLLRGDEYLAEKLQRIDVLKVDTQGAESQVIEGLLPLLRESVPGLRILIELTPLSLREANSSGAQLIGLLETLGQPFYIVDHIEHRLVASTAVELKDWCDNVDAHPQDEGFMNILVGNP